MAIKRAFLLFSFCVIAGVALLYGVSPQWFAQTFLGVAELDLDLVHILRAIMGLYLAVGFFFLFAAFREAYRNAAVLLTGVLCVGLLSGRVLSFAMDGQPSSLLMFYAGVEVIFILATYWVFRQPD